jgi:peptidylprolyl isomerase
MRPHPFALLAATGALALAAAGCGSEETVTKPEKSKAPAARTQSTATSALGVVPGPISTDTSKKPVIPKPQGTPPSKLVIKNIVQGKGAPAKAGDTVTVQYVGVSWSTGQQFDASWDRNEPFSFPLGQGQVIPGWDQGVAGMKPGGRRELVIPPDLAYGPSGSPPAIGPNETLVFVIDLIKSR